MEDAEAPSFFGDEEERLHWRDVLIAMQDYLVWMSHDIARRKLREARLPAEYKALLPPDTLEKRRAQVVHAVQVNQQFLDAVVQAQLDSGLEAVLKLDDDSGAAPCGGGLPLPRSSASHFSKVKSTLHQIVRDWCADGAAERAACYGPILAELQARLPVTAANRNQQRVLVPGCGLGRLVYECARAGYAAQGNEFSLFMLFTAHYILNCTEEGSSYLVHPWAHDRCNQWSLADTVRSVTFPEAGDAHPSALRRLNPDADFSMTAGEFCSVYGTDDQRGAWDALVFCFFLDTAPQVPAYLDTVWHALKPGGILISFGPLLYHWADAPDDPSEADDRYLHSIELSADEVLAVVAARGFTVLSTSTHKDVTYAANARSMMRTHYDALMFVAQKPAEAGSSAAAAPAPTAAATAAPSK